jgi:hypothetical protein
MDFISATGQSAGAWHDLSIVSAGSDGPSTPTEYTGRRGGLYDLFGRETRRLTQERAMVGTAGAVIGIRYLGPGIGRLCFNHSYAAAQWRSVDVLIDRVATWHFAEEGATRPIFVELSPGTHVLEVRAADRTRTRKDVLTRNSFRVSAAEIVEVRIYPRRRLFSLHLQRGSVTTRVRRTDPNPPNFANL